jgi:hydroxyacylglutathione hydrolase
MKIERFEIPGLAQYSYVVSDNGYAAVIDAIRDVDRYTDYAARKDLSIKHVLETHIHADFAAGSIALAEATGAELTLSAHDEGEHYQYAMPHRAMRDGDSVQIGCLQLKALHTSGHTPEHLSFVLFDTDRSASEPVALFSGDFLFVGSLGRPDLLGDEAREGLAHELYRSLHERIAILPDSVQVYPGHGAGSLCGAGMSEREESTLGYERSTNPLFSLPEEAFVEEILGSVPSMPDYYPRMKELNSHGAPSVSVLPGACALTTHDVAALVQQDDVTLLDLRRPETFCGAHISKALNIGAGQNLSLWAGWLLDPKKRIVLISDSGDDEDSRRALVRVGLDNMAGYLAQGMPAWIEAGFDFERTMQVSVHEVERLSPEALVVDVRSKSEWEKGHIPNAQYIMLADLRSSLAALPANRPLTTVCGSGYRSSIAASLLAQHGFSQVSSMAGGIAAWNRQNIPLTAI